MHERRIKRAHLYNIQVCCSFQSQIPCHSGWWRRTYSKWNGFCVTALSRVYQLRPRYKCGWMPELMGRSIFSQTLRNFQVCNAGPMVRNLLCTIFILSSFCKSVTIAKICCVNCFVNLFIRRQCRKILFHANNSHLKASLTTWIFLSSNISLVVWFSFPSCH